MDSHNGSPNILGAEMSGIERVGVVGAGLMGSGIVETAARAGCHVVIREISDEMVERGMARITKSINTAVDRGKMPPDLRDEALRRIVPTTSLADMHDREIVIEAAVENMDI